MLSDNEKYIIRKGKEFLVGCPYQETAYIRFSPYKYDGYRLKDFNKAKRIADIIGGKVMKLNTVNGDMTGGW